MFNLSNRVLWLLERDCMRRRFLSIRLSIYYYRSSYNKIVYTAKMAALRIIKMWWFIDRQ